MRSFSLLLVFVSCVLLVGVLLCCTWTDGPPISIFRWHCRASRTSRMRICCAPSRRYCLGIRRPYSCVSIDGIRYVSGMAPLWCLISSSREKGGTPVSVMGIWSSLSCSDAQYLDDCPGLTNAADGLALTVCSTTRGVNPLLSLS